MQENQEHILHCKSQSKFDYQNDIKVSVWIYECLNKGMQTSVEKLNEAALTMNGLKYHFLSS